MKKNLIISSWLVVLLSGPLDGFTQNTAPESEQTIAEKLLTTLQKAWNTADGNLYGSAFTDDADFVDIRGDYHQSKIAISKGHQFIFDNLYKGSVAEFTVLKTNRLNATTLVVHARQKINAPSGPLAGVNMCTLTFVMIRKGSDWKVASCQNTLMAEHSIDWKKMLPNEPQTPK